MSSSTPAVLAPWVNFSPAMQAFYAVRGMWADGEPRGLLATWLGTRTPWKTQGDLASFWLKPEGIEPLMRDVESAPALGSQQRAQFVRRLREAAHRAGLRQQQPQQPAAAVVRPSLAPSRAAAAPFDPLVSPPPGRARAAFVKHLHDSLRAVVEYSQQSAYDEAYAPRPSNCPEGGAA